MFKYHTTIDTNYLKYFNKLGKQLQTFNYMILYRDYTEPHLYFLPIYNRIIYLNVSNDNIMSCIRTINNFLAVYYSIYCNNFTMYS